MVRTSLVVALVAACGGASTRPGPTTTKATPELAAPPAEIVAGRASAEADPEAEADADANAGTGDGADDGASRLGLDGVGAGGGGRGTRHPGQQVPTVTIGAPATGNVNKELVRRVVRKHLDELRTCYETALLQHPGLAGTVVASFIISPDGTVANATATGLHPEVDGCIAARIATWTFPSPSGGGALHINYPFVFRQEN